MVISDEIMKKKKFVSPTVSFVEFSTGDVMVESTPIYDDPFGDESDIGGSRDEIWGDMEWGDNGKLCPDEWVI